ncbi:uncharacterized protein [Palaemon carinicauda]|uniref:uncharacterized protein n=1 Tax=Palaemon carinicauda TaxID=392227 RepID=UPI0035B5BD81
MSSKAPAAVHDEDTSMGVSLQSPPQSRDLMCRFCGLQKRTRRSSKTLQVAEMRLQKAVNIECRTGVRFLVDAGGCHSLLSRELFRTQHSLSKSAVVCLVAANRSAIPTYSYENLKLSFRNGKFKRKFLVADVIFPILSADFLSHFHLLVDVTHRRWVNIDLNLSTLLQPETSNHALLISTPTDAYAHLLTSYLEVHRPELRQTPTAPTKHGIYHHIKTTGPPVFAKFERLALDLLAASKETFAEMEEMGLCQKRNTVTCASCCLKHNGSVVRYYKCTFGANEVSFLGHRITPEEVHPLPEKVAAIQNFPTPSTVKALQELLGMINYYHRFLDVANAAVLERVVNGLPRLLAFFSKKLSKAECGYSTFDRELLAVRLAVHPFRHFLECTPFVICTDHMPLVHVFT